MNSKKTAASVDLAFHGNVLHLSLPAVSITTAMWSASGSTQNVATKPVAMLRP
jgi:hypothetical protein